ncbi:MAG: nicotinate-nucleotide--dimethylbenzimidazole phosphoribosyltransferase, partial [Endomicrobiales bacterium]
KVILTIAGDHGVAAENVSAFPQAVTAQMVYNFLNGGAGINVLARHVGAKVVVLDAGVASDLTPHPDLIIRKIGYGTRNMAQGPAMTREEAVRSVEAGMEAALLQIEEGANILAAGDMGIANTTASSAIVSVITGAAVEKVTGLGTGIDGNGLRHKIEVIKKAIAVNKPDRGDALDVLGKVGGFEIGAIAGVFLAGAARRVPVVIDGFISGAGALIACALEPGIRDYMFASHCSVEQGHAVTLDYLRLEPLLDLRFRLGEGTGAALGIGIIEAGVKILNEMATFGDAGVSEKNA